MVSEHKPEQEGKTSSTLKQQTIHIYIYIHNNRTATISTEVFHASTPDLDWPHITPQKNGGYRVKVNANEKPLLGTRL